MIGDLRVKVGPVQLDSGAEDDLAPGAVRVGRKDVWVGTASEPVRLGQIQPPGKKPMNAADWARGARLDDTVTAS
ncbi:hypothetical protein IWGMT90018_35660 [Mycobacterium kiyosense]|nr:hypothetical protein IWGMT90018_35660 [Mycobacterium kiyosense]